MNKYHIPVHATIGEVYGPAMQITDSTDAAEYLAALIENQIQNSDGKITPEEARRTQLSNLGYYAGYYDFETMARVEKLFGAVHPVFGSTDNGPVSAEAALALGERLGGR